MNLRIKRDALSSQTGAGGSNSMPRPDSPYVARRNSETLGASEAWGELREKYQIGDPRVLVTMMTHDALRQA